MLVMRCGGNAVEVVTHVETRQVVCKFSIEIRVDSWTIRSLAQG